MSRNRLRVWLSSAACLLPLTWAAAAIAQEPETAPPKVEQAVEESKEAAGTAQEAAAQEADKEAPEKPKEAPEKPEEAADEPKEKPKDAPKEAKDAAPEPKEAADSPAAAQGPKPALLVTNLDNPSGLAIHPESGHVFIATAVAVYHFAPEEKDKAKRINYYITGFPEDVYGKGPEYQIGPLGLAFFQKNMLVVGGGSRPDGEELSHVYEVNESADHQHLEPIKEGDAKFTLGPIKPGEQSARGEGNFYAVAVIGDSVFFSSNGDDTKGWVLRTQFQDGQFTELEPYIATKQKTAEKLEGQGVDAPVPLAVSPDGKQLVVGQMGEVNIPNDSLLTTYNPETGELLKLWKLEGVNDIAGLAIHPKTGEVFFTDFSWVAPEKGGLYRFNMQGENPEPVKVVGLDKPTALAFDKEGNLYVTVYGTQKEGSDTAPGQLLRFKAAELMAGQEPPAGE